jgi:hypothetical protein
LGQAEDLARAGRQYLEEWQATHDRSRLDAAIEALRPAVNLPWSRTENQVRCLGNLIEALSAGAEAGSDPYTNEVIDLAGQMIQISGNDAFLLGTRGYNLMLRYTRHGSLEDLNQAVIDFKKALAASSPGDVQIYRRALNVAWASEARFDRLGARGEEYRVIVLNGVERWRGPRDLVVPISSLETLLGPDNVLPPAPAGVLTRIKRNLANLLCRYALHVRVRPLADRQADMGRAVALLQEAMAEATPGSFDHTTIAQSLVATVQQGLAAELLAAER